MCFLRREQKVTREQNAKTKQKKKKKPAKKLRIIYALHKCSIVFYGWGAHAQRSTYPRVTGDQRCSGTVLAPNAMLRNRFLENAVSAICFMCTLGRDIFPSPNDYHNTFFEAAGSGWDGTAEKSFAVLIAYDFANLPTFPVDRNIAEVHTLTLLPPFANRLEKKSIVTYYVRILSFQLFFPNAIVRITINYTPFTRNEKNIKTYL